MKLATVLIGIRLSVEDTYDTSLMIDMINDKFRDVSNYGIIKAEIREIQIPDIKEIKDETNMSKLH